MNRLANAYQQVLIEQTAKAMGAFAMSPGSDWREAIHSLRRDLTDLERACAALEAEFTDANAVAPWIAPLTAMQSAAAGAGVEVKPPAPMPTAAEVPAAESAPKPNRRRKAAPAGQMFDAT